MTHKDIVRNLTKTKIVMNEDEDFNNGAGKTTKLWISPEMDLRWNEWPEVPPVKASIYADTFAMQQYEKELAKAKEESIPVDLNGFNADHLLTPYFVGSFIYFEGQVEVVCQQRRIFNGGWTDCSEEHYKSQYRSFPKLFRQVARLKPVEKVFIDGDFNDSYEARVRGATGKRNKVFDNDSLKAYEEGHYWNFETKDSGAMSYTEGMTDAEMNEALDALKDPLKEENRNLFKHLSEKHDELQKAKARIKELEQADAEGFEKYQELLIQNRNLKERVKELEDALADMITAQDTQTGLKDRILEAFCREYDGESMAYAMLIKVLSDLKIK